MHLLLSLQLLLQSRTNNFCIPYTSIIMVSRNPDACLEHPLGILCRCAEYKSISDKLKVYTISTLSPVLPKFNIEPIASGTVVWMPKKTEKFREGDEPLVFYCAEPRPRTEDSKFEKRWIPVRTDIVSPKYIRPNECYLHQSHMNTQSAETTTLTDMLPHRGRVVKRNDIRWDVGLHKSAIQMTDEPETCWGRATGCFTPWADAFTVSTGGPPF